MNDGNGDLEIQASTFLSGRRILHSWHLPAAICLAAVILRVCNLGTFSLWLDEVFTIRVAEKPLLSTVAACAQDAENVPLYAVVSHFGLQFGLTDPWLRLLPIAAGLASIGLLGAWTDRHFGRSAALLVAAFCALSTFHIRYSQELRAYPYLLLMCTATLMSVDRLRERPGWRSTALLAVVVGLGCYSNLTYALVLIPVTGLVVMVPPAGRPEFHVSQTRLVKQYAMGVGLGIMTFVPWIWSILPTLTHRLARPRTTDWDLEVLGQRWQGLTVAHGHFDPLTWTGALLAVFFVAGIVVSLRSPVGRAVLLPALAAVVAWEWVLVAVRHWTSHRYDTALWPFIAVLIALGFQRFLQFLRWRWLQLAACAAVIAMLLVRVDAYHRMGRPHWDLLADIVAEVHRPGESVVTVDNWSSDSLGFYLADPITSINGREGRLSAALARDPSVLLVSREPLTLQLRNMSATHAELARVFGTARLYRLRGRIDDRSAEILPAEKGQPRGWPTPVAELVAETLDHPPSGCLTRVLGRVEVSPAHTPRRIEFDSRDEARLSSGWGAPTVRDDGTTVAWVLGHEASIELAPVNAQPGSLRIRLRPHNGLTDPPWLRILLNGQVLGEAGFGPTMTTIAVDVPANVWFRGRGLLVLQFSRAYCTNGCRQSRSAAVDWIEWMPRSGAAAAGAS